jgi:hypothetical protein
MVVSSGVFGRTFICPPLIRARKNQQPSFYMSGKSDGLNELYRLSNELLRAGLPGVCRPRRRYLVGAQKGQKFCDVVTINTAGRLFFRACCPDSQKGFPMTKLIILAALGFGAVGV